LPARRSIVFTAALITASLAFAGTAAAGPGFGPPQPDPNTPPEQDPWEAQMAQPQPAAAKPVVNGGPIVIQGTFATQQTSAATPFSPAIRKALPPTPDW